MPTFAAFAASLILLGACSTSGPRPASSRAETAAAPPPAVAADPTAPETRSVPPVEVPERALVSYSRALSAMAAEDWLDAELELGQLVLEYPAFPGPFTNLAIIYRQQGRDDAAETALRQALALAPEHPAANNELGVLLRERGEFDQAEAAYRRAIQGDPAYALAHYNLGVLLDLYLKREVEALEQYEAYQTLVAEPDAEVGRWVIDLRRRLGLPDQAPRMAQEDGR
jgi:Tfp pilus assembly protein PilF